MAAKSNKSTEEVTMIAATYTTFVPESILTLIDKLDSKKAFPTPYTGGLSLSNPILKNDKYDEAKAHMLNIMECFGIDKESIGYIADISVTEKNGCKVWTPAVRGTATGDAVLIWGSSSSSLTELRKKGITITFAGDKYVSAVFEFVHKNVQYAIEAPLRVVKDTNITRQQARTAFTKGELGFLLQSKAANIVDIEAGLYEIVAVRTGSSFAGKTKHNMLLKGDKRWFSAPSKVQDRLNETSPTEYPTAEKPWSLKLGEVESMSKNGSTITFRKVLRVSTETADDTNLDAFILELPTTKEPTDILDELSAGFELE